MALQSPTHQQAAQFIRYCWLGYAVVWTFAMFGMKRTVEKWSADDRMIYLFSWVLAFALLLGWPRWVNQRLVGHGPQASLTACVICAMGLVVLFWARFVLGRNWSGDVTLKQDHELVERGPYRCVRHPIYTGLLLMVLGWAVERGTPGAFLGVIVFLVAHIWKLRREETLLLRNFPDSYPGYRSRTKALVPGIY